MCGGQDLNTYPRVIEEKDKIVILYSEKEPVEKEDEDGVCIYYSSGGEVVKIVIPKDDGYLIIDL